MFISPVMAFATEYENDIGWAGKRLLDSFSPRLRALWGLCEVASVFGTMAVAFLEVYFIMNGVFLSIGIAAIVAWTIWLLGSRLFWERCFERDSATSFMGHPRSSEPLAHPIQA